MQNEGRAEAFMARSTISQFIAAGIDTQRWSRCEPARQQRHQHDHCAENLPRFHDTLPYHPL